MIFDKNIIFDGKVEDLIDSLMHSTLLEIAVYIRTIELLLLVLDTRIESFYEDDTINTTEEIDEVEDLLGYYMGRKIQEHYLTPLATLLLVVLLAYLISSEVVGAPKI